MCCSGSITTELPGGTGPPPWSSRGGRSLPRVPRQHYSLRAKVGGGSADHGDHGGQHVLLQQRLAQERVGALCRQQEERDVQLPSSASGRGQQGPQCPRLPAGGSSSALQGPREPLLSPPGLQPRTYLAWRPARPWPADRAPPPGGSTSSPPRPAGTAGPRGAGSGTRRPPLGHCRPRSLRGTATVTPRSRCARPPIGASGTPGQPPGAGNPAPARTRCAEPPAALPFCTFRRCCSRTGTVSLTMLVCVDTAARACRQRCRRERRSWDLSSSRSEGNAHLRGALGWHPGSPARGHSGPSPCRGRRGAEARKDHPKASPRLPAQTMAGQLPEGNPSCNPQTQPSPCQHHSTCAGNFTTRPATDRPVPCGTASQLHPNTRSHSLPTTTPT